VACRLMTMHIDSYSAKLSCRQIQTAALAFIYAYARAAARAVGP
jgi:hypothetical protein